MGIRPDKKNWEISLDRKNQSNHHLVVHLTDKYFVSVSYDISKKTFHNFELFLNKDTSFWSSTLVSLLKQQVLSNPYFKKTSIITSLSANKIVPEIIFDPKNIATLLSIDGLDSINNKYYFNALNKQKLVNLFSISTEITDLLQNSKNTTFYHSSSFHLYHHLNNSSNQENVSLELEENKFQIVISKQGALKFNNTFHYNNLDELIYFLLLALKQEKIDAKTLTLSVFGSLNIGGIQEILLTNYISKIELFEPVINNKKHIADNLYQFFIPLICPSCAL